MKNIFNFLFSPILLATLLFLSAFFMALATFLENDHGAAFSYATVYNAWWFELLLVLLTINLLGRIITRKLYTKKKLPVFLFHFALSIMLIGAGLTRYIGYEGIMHIREGESSSSIALQESGFDIKVSNNSGLALQYFIKKDFNELQSVNKTYSVGNKKLNVIVKNYYENAHPKAIPNPAGKIVIGFIASGNGYRGLNYIEYGKTMTIGNITFAFNNNTANADFNFTLINDSIFLKSSEAIFVKNNDNTKSIVNEYIAINKGQLYQTQDLNIVVQKIFPEATIIAQAIASKDESAQPAIELELTIDKQSKTIYLWPNSIESTELSELQITTSFGKRNIVLPFEIHLDRFEIERYPGSNSPSSFSSYVTIKEQGKEARPFHIYMNNILKLNGYRFFQSSYDQDEKGTILSVSYDIWGTTVTYVGYFLLFLGMLLALISKNSFFRNTSKLIKQLVILFGIITLTTSSSVFGQDAADLKANVVDAKHAEEFGKLLIQNNKGRTEPIYTLASEIVRKLSRAENLYGLTPVQTFIELNINPEQWSQIPLIKISNNELRKFLGIKSKYAAYSDFITADGRYKLQKIVGESYAKPPIKRNKFDKEILKADEKINICYSLFIGNYLKVFPQQDSTQTAWLAPNEAYKFAKVADDSTFLRNIMQTYFQELVNAKSHGGYKQAMIYLKGISKYQQKYATYNLPSDFHIKTEVLYYKWNIFKNLFPFYALLGFVFLILLITSIIKGISLPEWLKKSFFITIFIAFIIHTLGIAARWYISGHAPMSNGYESMIFISWVTILAGFIFSKRSSFALSATTVLAGMTLMVANLSFMDPQITNLVPVLKSYWLTLHVSIITGSYSFLGLGAIVGIINQILFIARNKRNANRINETLQSLTALNHQTLIVGLYFLTIGTFLGAIWANESWGRYWGWDPKETWSLITIIVYTFVTHARMIPGFKGIFAFNILSLYGFSSVLMTYFGVNYYLSGMHSYGSGDPVPVPTFVYYSIAILLTLSIFAWRKYKNNL